MYEIVFSFHMLSVSFKRKGRKAEVSSRFRCMKLSSIPFSHFQQLNDLGESRQRTCTLWTSFHLVSAVYALPEQPDWIAEPRDWPRELPKDCIDDLGCSRTPVTCENLTLQSFPSPHTRQRSRNEIKKVCLFAATKSREPSGQTKVKKKIFFYFQKVSH